MEAQAIKFRQYGEYDEGFWHEQNLIKPDKNFNLAFQRLTEKTGLKISSEGASDSETGTNRTDNKSYELNFVDLDLTKQTAHFKFLYTPFDSSIIDSIERKLEENYERILNDLNVKKLPIIEIKIYPSIETYHSSINYPNAPDWMIGSAGINKIEIVSPKNPGPYHADDPNIMDGIIHEFTHCVHIHLMKNNFGAVKSNDIRWLWEAVACYESHQLVDPGKLEYLQSSATPTLEDLNDVESGKIYELGFHLIDFLKTKWGMRELISLIKTNGDLQKVLKLNEKEFEKQFVEFMRVKYFGEQEVRISN
jgi:hypothetical protein